MTFDIPEKMVGLSVINALDGNIIGESTRLVFGRRNLNFRYVQVEGNDTDNRLLYLRYPDILRMNERAILCLTDERSFTEDYLFFNDPDAFILVGNEAVDERGKLIGQIESARIDEDAKVISFTIRRGHSRGVFDINRLVDIKQNGFLVVRLTEEDVFTVEEEVEPEVAEPAEQSDSAASYNEEETRSETEEGAEEEIQAETQVEAEGEIQAGAEGEADAESGTEAEAEETKAEEAVSDSPEKPRVIELTPLGGSAEEREQAEAQAAAFSQEPLSQEPVRTEAPQAEEKKSDSVEIQWGPAPSFPNEGDRQEDEAADGKKKKKKAPKEKAPKEKKSPGFTKGEKAVGGENPVLATIHNMDLISGLRYAAFVAFFAACVILGK